MGEDQYFQTRFTEDTRRDVLWRTLCRHYFARLIDPEDTVLELGAGYGAFINNVTARRRVAIDTWEGFLEHLSPGVEGRVGDVADLSFLQAGSVNFAFASNLFEHVTQEHFAAVLCQLKPALAAGGTLTILQPNFYFAYRQYFDDYTHRAIYTHTSLCDFLEANGYAVVECRPRFLPLTLKSRLPVSETLIRMYLRSPWKPLARQMLVRARLR